MAENDLIEQLGGPKVVAELVGSTRGAVLNWRLRNTIPWKYRPTIARIAGERAIQLPADFWEGVAA